LLLCVSTGLSACACPENRAESGAKLVSTLAAAGDVCADCGHTKNCCISHIDMPVVESGTGAVVQTEPQFVPRTLIVFDLIIPNKRALSLIRSGVNRAPPWSSTQTPVALRQKLVI
jgi:hypothetical protein